MRTVPIALSCLLLLAACGGDEVTPDEPAVSTTPPVTTSSPERVVVDHILIAVKNARIPDGKTPEEAKALADDLMEQLEAGADWAALKREHSADPPPGGPYTMLTRGRADHARSIFMRGEMAKAFGDVGFSLEVGELGVAPFDPATSPFGFHIIKRVE
jgi:hypothetical protein